MIEKALGYLSGAAAALFLAGQPAGAEELHIYNWSDYIDLSLIGKFERETGIDVVYDVYESNQMLEAKLLAGRSGYDVVVPSDAYLKRQIEAGVFMPLDYAKLPNAANRWEVIRERTAVFDPGNTYSINYLWGTTGIGVNVDKVTEILGPEAPMDSLALVFDPANMEKLAACGVNFLDTPLAMIPPALICAGESPNATDPEALEKAEAVLAAVRPHVRTFDSAEFPTGLANGDICVSVGWSGDVLAARNLAREAGNGITIAYHPFREGSAMWFDQMAIPADAPNPDAAHRFLNFMLEPENIAAVTNHVFYANGNLPSQAFVDPAILDDPAIYPDAEALENLWVFSGWDPDVLRKATRMWTRVKSGI